MNKSRQPPARPGFLDWADAARDPIRLSQKRLGIHAARVASGLAAEPPIKPAGKAVAIIFDAFHCESAPAPAPARIVPTPGGLRYEAPCPAAENRTREKLTWTENR